MDQILDISDVRENDSTFCHSVLFILISCAVQRGAPTIVINILLLASFICNIFGKKCSERNLLKGLHLISI